MGLAVAPLLWDMKEEAANTGMGLPALGCGAAHKEQKRREGTNCCQGETSWSRMDTHKMKPACSQQELSRH